MSHPSQGSAQQVKGPEQHDAAPASLVLAPEDPPSTGVEDGVYRLISEDLHKSLHTIPRHF